MNINDKQRALSGRTPILETMLLLTIFLIPLWPRYVMIYITGLPNINLTRALIFTLVMLWVLTIFGFEQYGQKYRNLYREHRKVVLATIALLAWRVLSVINIHKLKSVYIFLDELFTWYLLSAVGVAIMSNMRSIHRVLLTMILTCFIMTILGLVEAYIGHNLFVYILPTETEEVGRMLVAKYREYYRIMATFTSGLSLAEYLAFMLPAVFYSYVYSTSGKAKILSLCTFLLALLNIWLTGSRGAWVVLIMMGLSFSVLYYRRRMKKGPRKVGFYVLSVVVPVLLILFLGGFFIIFEYVKGDTLDEMQSSHARLRQLEIGLPLVLERPFIGYGLGEAAAEVGMRTKSVDNYYLTISLESGLPSLLLLLSILFWIIKNGYDIYMKRNDEIGALAGALATSLLGFAIFQSVLSLKEVFPIVFLTFSMLLGLRTISASDERPEVTAGTEGHL